VPGVGRLVERGTGAAIAACVAALLSGGCGSGSGARSVDAGVVARAAAKTTAAPARMHERITGSYKGRYLGEGSMSGRVDAPKGLGDIEYDLGFLTNLNPKLSKAELKGRLILVGDSVFYSSPLLDQLLPHGKRWGGGSYAELAADSGPSAGLAGVGGLDPRRPVDVARAAGGDVEDLGSAVIAGAPTHHYRVKIDYRRYLPLAPSVVRAGLKKAVDKIGATFSTTTFPIEVWIGADGTIRRYKGELNGRGLEAEYTIDITETGRPVRIRRPPRSEVLDVGGG
jgi:hypothetical protein